MINFKEYLCSKGITPFAFCKKSKVSKNTIYKLYHGKQIRIDAAKRIVRDTKKEISLEDLGYVTKKRLSAG